MKSRSEFETEKEFLEYLRIYMSTKAMQGMLIAHYNSMDYADSSDTIELAKASAGCADALINVLFLKEEIKPVPVHDVAGVVNKKAVYLINNVVAAKEQPKKKKQEIEAYIHMGASLLANKQYKEALASYTNALSLDPNNKHIQADIKLCENWIRRVAELEVKEEEFTTNIPSLND